MQKTNKLLAFTLAETLVVIGLIGIVSALTLPNLNKNTGDIEQVARVKKQQQVLTEAYGRARAKYGTNLKAWLQLDANDVDASTRVANRFMEFMTIKKDCGTSANQGCFSSSNLTYINGGSTSSIDSEASSHKFIANDGTSYAIYCNLVGRPGMVHLVGAMSGCYITIDVDGPNKGLNKVGKDVFQFTITGKSPQIFTSSLSSYVWNFGGSSRGCKEGDPLVCSAFVLEFGNTNYPTLSGGSFVFNPGSGVASGLTWKPGGFSETCTLTMCPIN